MHRRARHLNAASAGAMFVLDARYINQADNSAVSTWKDRSSNGYDVTQATGANQPTLQVGEVGGSSVVRFDGNNDYLVRSDTGFPTGNFTYVGAHKQTNLISQSQYGVIFHYGQSALTQSVFLTYGDENSITFPLESFGVSQYGDGIAVTNSTLRYIIGSVTRSGTNYNVRIDGGTPASRTMGTNTVLYGINGLGVGAGNAGFSYGSKLTGDIGSVALFNTLLSDSLRKRIEHCAAYSFKLACA